ncbi:ArsR/SmtB family transcription factor [Cohnella thailandensis]|uniref:Helix-turn-helix transcriptional regulator n=1 Tax=Cohnella thailandensis TaxID=557557 RepID=A0A841T6W8_9BACL|nr:metalloregulator ArsR/SmtB family transcription factor [Cohnella thailandensis]MBB6637597.1 helix-turn-helix transcriptional regulator [Cohnella thailandensis]MBP1974227.1 DNA-binding transcriptional ArsR family regulator [Cohnella thailandensis]
MNNEQSHLETVKIYKALGEPNRLSIVKLLTKHKELCCTEIEEHLDFKGSTLSHHLKQLADCGVLKLSRKEGTFHYYQLNQDTLKRYVAVETVLD